MHWYIYRNVCTFVESAKSTYDSALIIHKVEDVVRDENNCYVDDLLVTKIAESFAHMCFINRILERVAVAHVCVSVHRSGRDNKSSTFTYTSQTS